MKRILLLLLPFIHAAASQYDELNTRDWEQAILSSKEIVSGQITAVKVTCQHGEMEISEQRAETLFNDWLYGDAKPENDNPPPETKKPNPNLFFRYDGNLRIDRVFVSSDATKESVTFHWLEPYFPSKNEDSLMLRDRITLVEYENEYRLLLWDEERIMKILQRNNQNQSVDTTAVSAPR